MPKEQRTEMPYYENVFIARQDISSQQVDLMTEEFSKLVSDNGGEVPKTEYWGVRGLTYRIKKSRKGHYVLMNLDAPPDTVDELEAGPSVMLLSRGGRGCRGDRGERGGRSRDDQLRTDGVAMVEKAEIVDGGEE